MGNVSPLKIWDKVNDPLLIGIGVNLSVKSCLSLYVALRQTSWTSIHKLLLL